MTMKQGVLLFEVAELKLSAEEFEKLSLTNSAADNRKVIKPILNKVQLEMYNKNKNVGVRNGEIVYTVKGKA